MIRSLFCLANASISGGNKAILEYARGLRERGQTADIFVWHTTQNLQWFDDSLKVIANYDIESLAYGEYDVVFFAKAFLIPLAFPHLNGAKPVFICHDFESAYIATTYQAISLECPAFDDVLRLPIDIITTSKPVQKIMEERLSKKVFFVPLAIDKAMFTPQTPRMVPPSRKRVLMVGDHLLPTKGIRDGLKALKLLADEIPIELVLITREERGKQIFDDLNYPSELHVRPDPKDVQNIYASCDIYCCTSWYEGFGLPALEAFRVGIPVVSTRNSGVSNYGIDQENLLLCEPNDPLDLSKKIKTVLENQELRTKLIAAGRITEEQYSWARTMEEFVFQQKQILDDRENKTPSIAPDKIAEIIEHLEATGLYTPHSVHVHCSELFNKLDQTLLDLIDSRVDVVAGLAKMSRIRNQLRTYLTKPNAEYYNSCKKRFDLCQLVIAFGDDSRFPEHLSKIVSQLHLTESKSPSQLRAVGASAGSKS